MCIICFLTDLNQYNLRKSAQYRSDRFEHSLKLYKESFIVNFKKSLEDELCEVHRTSRNEEIKKYLKLVDINDVKQVFDTLLDVYLYWIDGETSISINKLDKLLVKYNIKSSIEDIHNHIFFRGRISKKFISHWDMFHIPFNKRFIISNQRYSLIGQPLLYLAKSPICVINELEQTENLRISTFRFKEQNEMKIFDNTNKFLNIITLNKEVDNNVNSIVDNIINYNTINIDNNVIRMYLLHLIICGCCSFEKRNELKDYGFCEEYILPQILAQSLKSNNVHGILYSSTKAPNKFQSITNATIYNMFSHNLALFTKYDKSRFNDETYVYDKDLYTKFKISNPILFRDNSINSFNCEQKEYNCITTSIINYLHNNYNIIEDLLKSSVWNNISRHDHHIVVGISDIIVSYSKYFNNENFNKKESNIIDKAINLHLFMLQNVMLNIRNYYMCNNY